MAQTAYLLVQQGCRVSVLCPPGHPARKVPGVKVHEHSGVNPLRALSRAIAAGNPAMVVPADDRAVVHLHQLHRTGSASERELVERSLGAAHGFAVTASRSRLLKVAQRLGIAVPEGGPIASPAELETWLDQVPGPWVLKVNGAWGGNGVRIPATREDARGAFHRLSRWLNVRTMLTRVVIKRDSFWVSDWFSSDVPEVTAQAHVRGRPANLAMLCRDGEVLAASVVETVVSMGHTGSSTIVRVVERPGLVADARRLARELGLSGFHGLDFMVEEATDRALLIELNPRLTPLSNIRLEPGRDPVGAVATLLTGAACTPPVELPAGRMVAFFPTAIQSGCDERVLFGCFQDGPWGHPVLIDEMMRLTWPERALLSRLATACQRLVQRASRGDATSVTAVTTLLDAAEPARPAVVESDLVRDAVAPEVMPTCGLHAAFS